MSYFARIAARARGPIGSDRDAGRPAAAIPAVPSFSPIAQIDQRWNVPPVGLFDADGDDIERIEAPHDDARPLLEGGPIAAQPRPLAPAILPFAHRSSPSPPRSPSPALSSAPESTRPPAIVDRTERSAPHPEPLVPRDPLRETKADGAARIVRKATALPFDKVESAPVAGPRASDRVSSSVAMTSAPMPAPAPTASSVSWPDDPRAAARKTNAPKPDPTAPIRKAFSVLERWLESPPREVGERAPTVEPSPPVAPSITPAAYATPLPPALAPKERHELFVERPTERTRPTIEIGRIDVQVIAPPPPPARPAPREPRRAPAPSTSPVRPPFGWRQRWP